METYSLATVKSALLVGTCSNHTATAETISSNDKYFNDFNCYSSFFPKTPMIKII
jgi:hypothetical protein